MCDSLDIYRDDYVCRNHTILKVFTKLAISHLSLLKGQERRTLSPFFKKGGRRMLYTCFPILVPFSGSIISSLLVGGCISFGALRLCVPEFGFIPELG